MEKPSFESVSEDIAGTSMGVASTMSGRLFEGDLPEGRDPKSCILIAGVELVAIQSLA